MAGWKLPLAQALHAAWDWLQPLIPGALGAAVGQAWERGLGLRDRVIQWVVGLLFAAYVVPALGHLLHWGQPVTSAVGFVVGTIAFKAVGKWREAAIEGGAGAFRSLPEIVRSWLRRPGVTPETPKEG
ncbi:hypothetical protein [Brevundimonas sp. CEF1]|uniref:hypothetical protein n=1 Tax=Brevundimonas sp. CEF1 TaxID=3442642 RepID=UPI003F519862